MAGSRCWLGRWRPRTPGESQSGRRVLPPISDRERLRPLVASAPARPPTRRLPQVRYQYHPGPSNQTSITASLRSYTKHARRARPFIKRQHPTDIISQTIPSSPLPPPRLLSAEQWRSRSWRWRSQRLSPSGVSQTVAAQRRQRCQDEKPRLEGHVRAHTSHRGRIPTPCPLSTSIDSLGHPWPAPAAGFPSAHGDTQVRICMNIGISRDYSPSPTRFQSPQASWNRYRSVSAAGLGPNTDVPVRTSDGAEQQSGASHEVVRVVAGVEVGRHVIRLHQ